MNLYWSLSCVTYGRVRPSVPRITWLARLARTTDSVAFSDDPSVTPGRGLQPQVDTVLFSGTGEWNGRSGYRYQVCAVDRGDLGFQRDSLRLTITSPSGTVVAQFSGVISGGFIESERVRR